MSDMRVVVPILDLGCGGAGSVLLERSLSRVAGVKCAYVNPAREVAYIDFDPALVSVGSLISRIRIAGFAVGVPQTEPAVGNGLSDERIAEADGASVVSGGGTTEPWIRR